MAATPNDYSPKNYYSISNGLFVIRRKEPTEKTTTRIVEKRDGTKKEVYEEQFKDISGRIKSVLLKTVEFDNKKIEFYSIAVSDVGTTEYIEVQCESGYGDSFMDRVLGIDFSKEVTLKPYCFVPKGKTSNKMGITVEQDGQKIGSYFSKEEPKGKPQPTPMSGAEMKPSDWKIYNIQVREFYKDMIASGLIAERIENSNKPTKSNENTKESYNNIFDKKNQKASKIVESDGEPDT